MNHEIELLKRRIDRERLARRQAESILEQKALELYNANGELRVLNESLEFKITERTRALETSQTRLSALISNLHSGILVEDESRHIVLTNQMFCDIFNIPAPPEALAGMDCSQSAEQSKHLFENPKEFVARVEAILLKRSAVINEKCVMADGRVYERDYVPILLDGQYSGHLWQYSDVTAEHYAREDLVRSEEKYRGIIENMELGLMEVDNDGYIVRPYPRFCTMVGYEADELMGKEAISVLLPPEYLPVLEQQAVDRAAGIATVYEIQLIKKDGSRIWVIISGAPIFDLDGSIVGSIGIHYDITYQKKLQHELEEAKLRAEEAQEAEKQFLANMSHEIRTPLNAIIGMAHLLYDTQPTTEQKEYLSVLKNSAEILRGLISDVLDLSKIRSGNFEMQHNEFDLVGLVHSMVKTFQMRFEDKPLTISLEMDDSLEYMVMGDDLMLNQILINLIGNAEKFTAEGKITIALRVKSRSEGHIEIEFSISDTGIGIPKEKHDLIFQSFRQVDGNIKRKFGGTGLGLAITKQLIEMQGGTIHLDSELGKGTTFSFNMFYQETTKKILLEDKPIAENTRIDAAGKRVLVVEDNHMNRKYISTLLKKWQVDYQMAHNGLEGVEMARLERFDLILMDIQMPVMDGYEATIAIRNTANPNRETTIIALTASAMLSQKDTAYRAGMNDYISKPFKPSQLYEKMQEYCCHQVIEITEPIVESSDFKEPIDIPVSIEEVEDESDFKFNKRLNADLLADLYGKDMSYAYVMFEMFLTTALPEFDTLKTAISEKNIAEIARLAHKLKPTFGMVGLSDMEEKMQALEHAAKKKEAPSVWQPLFDDVEKNMDNAVNAVRRDFDKLKKYETELHSG
jgi:PAS domain S-box-containing protein